ncbi:ion transporter [Shewanella fodinae]|jgi:voltage-gated potassium channel|uniref:Voltage-gated potassium channel n=1 Tax=Shewanella fodinae TaxID=552357 RepID=A0A4R2FG76_9GAMM|nr:ion transporter [Shewanella fodinae]MDN5368823.1 voltage-gated potassium channel [Shewanella sp.]MCD8476440.1 ion transporter [Shewanella fodinae]MCL2907398.1 ion transporter [Shewanella fodinae]TCN88929.1 voltage-gated potassium channel [Shewanella fodinae]GGZ08476.1 ion transporter [Shewanella fodinae]
MKLKGRWANNIQLSPFELVMMLLSLFSVVLILCMALLPMDKETRKLLFFIDTSICCIFLINFFVGLLRSDNKSLFLKEHWIDFVASIPAIEPLRFARLFQILRVIRLLRMSRSILGSLLKQRRQTTLASLLLAMVTIVAFASVLILLVENGEPGANIKTAEDAIWWSLVTISTVGYGDFYPVTTVGHVIGGLVILCGVSFFGVISGYMASLFVAPDEQENLENQRQAFKHQLDDVLQRMEHNQQQMLQEITALKQQLTAQQHK